MPKSKLEKLRADKSGNINTSLFNFLENLLVFRSMPELSVPRESGVSFRISRRQGEPGICLLFHVDNQLFPIVAADVPRPDYLDVYLHGSGCICTIIEMKGTAEKNLKHGLDQIKVFADRLKVEFEAHLPRRFSLHIQGILLHAYNAGVPLASINNMARGGLTIFPAQYDKRAELYPYISKKNDLRSGFVSEPRSPSSLSPIEQMLSQDTLKQRVEDALTRRREGAGAGKGLHINFVLSELDDYAVLITGGRKCVLFVAEKGEDHIARLRSDIAANELGDKFDVEPMPQA